MKRLAILALVLVPSSALAGDPFDYLPPGDLITDSGQGRVDDTVYAPGMRFPHEEAPSFANSQVYMHGGYLGPGGGECDAENYAYPWRDNYCEIRDWDMPLCPAGTGHQGQDVRPATCEDQVHWNIAPSDGTITNVGSYSVYVTAADGTRYDMLHGANNLIAPGDPVTREQRINNVSNQFGGTFTTIHTHFNIKQDVAGVGFVFVPPYRSLIESYQELLGLSGAGAGSLDAVDCQGVNGWAFDEANPDTAVTVRLSFDGAIEDAGATVVEVVADQHRDDLCDTLGSCEHAFSVEAPLSLRDGQPHDVHAYAVGDGRTPVEIEASPLSLQCQPPKPPSGVRRLIAGPDVVAAWGISPFWDVAPIGDGDLAKLAEDRDFPSEPVLVVSETSPDTVWLIDPGFRREVSTEAIAAAWGLTLDDAVPWPDNVLDDLPIGTPVRDVRFLVKGGDGKLWAIDDPQSDGGGGSGGSDGGGTGNGGGGAGDGGQGGGGSGSSSGDAAADDGGHGGCGCRTTGRSSWLWLGVFALGFAVRRRR